MGGGSFVDAADASPDSLFEAADAFRVGDSGIFSIRGSFVSFGFMGLSFSVEGARGARFFAPLLAPLFSFALASSAACRRGRPFEVFESVIFRRDGGIKFL